MAQGRVEELEALAQLQPRVGMGAVRQKPGRGFRSLSAAGALRRKEWMLLWWTL